MKSHLDRHQAAIGLAGALISLVIAIAYLLVVPVESSGVNGMQQAVLEYGHSFCWFLLSGASLAWALEKTNRWSVVLVYAALIVYVVFLITLVSVGW